MKYLSLFIIFFSLSFSVLQASSEIKEATYYADNFEGGSTANGDTFEQVGYSAALCGIKLDQYVYVSRWGTGVVLDANDRPNCQKHPNVIDLSQESFRLFAPISVGRIRDVSVTDIGPSPTQMTKKFLPSHVFAHLWVTLTSQVPNILFAWQGITVSGKTDPAAEYVIVYISHEDGGYEESHLEKVSPKGIFQAKIILPDAVGNYSFVIGKGKSFNTSTYATISLIPQGILEYPILEKKKISWIPRLSPDTVLNIPSVDLPKNTFGIMKITQWSNTVIRTWNSFILKDAGLTIGKAKISVDAYTTSTASPLDKNTESNLLYTWSVILDRSHDTIGREKLRLRMIKNNANILFKTPKDIRIRSQYYLTKPDGSVTEYVFPPAYRGSGAFLMKDATISFRVSLPTDWGYMLEVVREDGLAFANIPIQKGNVWPIIPPLSQREITTLSQEREKVMAENFSRINMIRRGQDQPEIILDAPLSKVAQGKVQDMIWRGYAGHADPDGKYIDTLARKMNIPLPKSIGENIWYGTVSHLALQDGLEESGVHKYNMLASGWKRVGIGYGVNNGNAYLVQIFWE